MFLILRLLFRPQTPGKRLAESDRPAASRNPQPARFMRNSERLLKFLTETEMSDIFPGISAKN